MPLHKSLAVCICCLPLLAVVAPHRAEAGVPKKGLIGYWSGDGNALDSSPTGNNGSFAGPYVPGSHCHHVAFDVFTNKVYIPNSSLYDFENYPGWTVGFWFNADQEVVNTGNAFFLGQDDGSGYQNKWEVEYRYSVYISGSTGTFVLHLNDPQQLRIFIESQPVAFPSGWNQLTVVWTKYPGAVSFYLNGQSIGTDSYGGIIPYPSADLIFGSAESGLGYNGLLDYVAIYNRALTAKQVQDLARPQHMCPS